MAVSEAHKKASYKYNSARDNIMIRPTKEEGAAIRAAAAADGKSVQAYILDILRKNLNGGNDNDQRGNASFARDDARGT